MAAIASSMFSPAIKRRVTRLNPGSFEKRSFSSVFCERYKRAALEIMPGSVFVNYHSIRGYSENSPESNFITRSPVFNPRAPRECHGRQERHGWWSIRGLRKALEAGRIKM